MRAKPPALIVGDAIMKSAEYLKKHGVETPRLDAELLLARVLDCDRLRIYMDWQKPLLELEISAYRDFIRRRGVEREPVARITGRREFYKREFMVTPDTFSPRPETEGVVERALSLLTTEPALQGQRCTVFEVGTGSGCIITTLAAESDGHRYLASDISSGALAGAKANAHRHGVDHRIEFRHGPLFAGFDGTLHMIVSNPPYIETGAIAGLPPEVRLFDPMPALDGGADGLDIVRQLADAGARMLIPGGWIVLEIGEGQCAPACAIFEATNAFDLARGEKDLAGLDRYVTARKQ